MEVERTLSFNRDFGQLPQSLKRRVEKALRLLVANPKHPSLEARVVDRRKRIWKAKINGGYRLTFQVKKDIILLRRVGAHGPMERPAHW